MRSKGALFGCGTYSVQCVGASGMRRPDVDMVSCGRHFSSDESFIEDDGREGVKRDAVRMEAGFSQGGMGAEAKRGIDSKL